MQAGNIKPVNASENRRSAFDGSGKDQQPQTRTLAPQPTRATAPASPIKKSLVEIVGNYPVEIRYRNCYDPNPENPRHMGYLYIRVLKAEDIATLRSLVGDMSIVFDGKNFSIICKNNSSENIYVQSAKLNGKTYTKSYIMYQDMMKGGTLELQMGNQPSKWGTRGADRP